MFLTLRLPEDPAWRALLAPVTPVLARALARLEPRPDVIPPVVPGHPGVLVSVTPDALALDPALLDGPHPLDTTRAARSEEAAVVALDRWRRASAAVLEGAALLALPDEPGAPAWWRVARAVEAADRAAPELGILWSELADWMAAPEEGVGDGRRGAWYVRWAGPSWRAPDVEAWRAFGAYLFGRAGEGAPVHLVAVPTEPGDWNAAPLSFRRVRLRGGAAGASLGLRGVVGDAPRLPADERATVLLASLAGGSASARLEPVGPVGTWVLRSGRTGERFGAARGIEVELRADGTGEVTLADAFIGPATESALSLAAQFGVSGTLLGRWRVVAVTPDILVELGEVKPMGVTVHPRGRFGFAMPAGPFLGRAEGWLSRIGGTRWRIRPIEGGVEAEGGELGPTIVLRLGRPDGPSAPDA